MNSGIWLTLAGLGLSNVIEQMDRYVFQVAPIPYVDYQSYTYSLLAGTLFSVVYCFGNITMSVWNDYLVLNRVTVVAMSCFLSSLSLLFVPFVKNILQLGLLRVMMGLAQSPITTFSASLIKDCFNEEWRGIAFGVFGSGTFFGFAFSLTLGTIIYHSMGWQAPYIIFGVLGVGYALVLNLVAKDPDATTAASGYGTIEADSSEHASLKIDSGIASPIHDRRSNGAEDGRIGHPNYEDGDNYYDSSLSSRSRNVRCECNMVARKIYTVAKYSVEYPSIILMCIACLVRFCGGYCYAYYVGIFFSELYQRESAQSTGLIGTTVACTYSYEAGNATAASLAGVDACSSSNFPYCIDGACTALNPTPWHNVGMPHNQFEAPFAAATVVGSVAGCILGGYVGDWVSTYTRFGVAGRLLVAGISLLIAGPMYLVLYTQSFPVCFVALALGGLFGEIYFAQTMAVLAEMVPKRLFTIMTSVFTSIFTGIGSNATLLVPLLRSYFDSVKDSHTFTISASPTYTSSSVIDGLQSFIETIPGAVGLQESLVYLVVGTYLVGGALFLACVPLVSRDLAKVVKE